jgi:hypothetical protein
MQKPNVYLPDGELSSNPFIKSGFRSFDKFIGGGFQPGYPWLFVADPEAEGIAASAVCIMSFNFAARGYPTFIMTTRSPWCLSLERYQKFMPNVHKKLKKACDEGRLLAANFWAPPEYKSPVDFEMCIDLALMPGQIYEKMVKLSRGLKSKGKPIFWRLTSISDLAHFARYYGDRGVTDLIELITAWLQVKGATGVASINRKAVSEALLNRVVSIFPNVAYVSAELERLTKYYIQVAKSINPDASSRRKELKITPKYEIVLR